MESSRLAGPVFGAAPVSAPWVDFQLRWSLLRLARHRLTDQFLKPFEAPLQDEEQRIKSAYASRLASVDGRVYSCLNPGNLFAIQERERCVLRFLEKQGYIPLETKKILEIGCGSGFWIREFVKWGVRPENIVGIDLLPERIAQGKNLCPPSVTLQIGNAARLESPSASFDLVLQSTVFSSILDPTARRKVAEEMLRVLKPGGAILWYDFFVDNPRNADVVGISKKEICRLFPNCDVILRRMTLAPPLARALAPRSWLLCSCLAALRFLDTHYLALIRPKGRA